MEQWQDHNVEWHVGWEIALATMIHMQNVLTPYLIS